MIQFPRAGEQHTGRERHKADERLFGTLLTAPIMPGVGAIRTASQKKKTSEGRKKKEKNRPPALWLMELERSARQPCEDGGPRHSQENQETQQTRTRQKRTTTRDHEQGPPRGSRVPQQASPAPGVADFYCPAGFPSAAASIRDIASCGRPIATRQQYFNSAPQKPQLANNNRTKINQTPGLG